MQLRFRARTTVVPAAASLLLLFVFADRASGAIAVDNDVTVGWSDTFPCVPNRCEPLVVGAPRLLRHSMDAAQPLRLTITASNESQEPFRIVAFRLRVHTGDLRDVCIPSVGTFECPLFLDYSEESGSFAHHTGKSLADLIAEFPQALPFPLVLTLEGSFRGNIGPTPTQSPVTVTLSGGGKEVIIDRVGDDDDFHPKDALDVPVRSVQMALALSQIHTNLRQHPGELDSAPRSRERNRPVGFTHTFNLPDDSSIEGAMLILHLRSGVSGVTNDFVLLDEGVSMVAAEGPGPAVARIFLRDVLGFPPVGGESYLVQLNLRRMLVDLKDRQLNVIVADDSEVDFSDLRITLRDR